MPRSRAQERLGLRECLGVTVDARHLINGDTRERSKDEVYGNYRLPHNLKRAVADQVERFSNGAVHQILNRKDAELGAAV